MIINGTKAQSVDKFKIYNPYNKNIVGEASIASDDDLKSIVDYSSSYKCDLNNDKKKTILEKTAIFLEDNKKEFAITITQETGLSMKDSIYEIGRVINCARYSIKVCDYVNSDITENFVVDDLNHPKLTVIKEPLDLVLAITPFNHPMNQVAHKIFPAIISGAPIILKPSEKSPLSSIRLVETLILNGLPSNMINVITTNKPAEMLDKILLQAEFDMVTFTGGLTAGLNIKDSMIRNNHSLKKYVPELGGSSSLIICKDGDINLAVRHIMNGCFKNSGQRCTSIRRVVAEDEIVDILKEKLLEKVRKIRYGDPFDENTDLGTVINEESAIKIQKRIDSAIEQGAELIFGNIRNGALLSPTILDYVDLKMDLVKNETFGPVCPIIRAKDFENALDIAKKTQYQLAGAIITKDSNKAQLASNYLKVGQFNFNGPPSYRTEVAPFGGFGSSGNGEKEGILMAAQGMQRVRTFYNHN